MSVFIERISLGDLGVSAFDWPLLQPTGLNEPDWNQAHALLAGAAAGS